MMRRLWVRGCLWIAAKLLHRHGYRIVRTAPFGAMAEEQVAFIQYLQTSGALATYHARRNIYHGLDRMIAAMDAAADLSPMED